MPRPSFQFYTGDWLRNTKLRAVSFQHRGIWIDLLSHFGDSEEFGLLRWELDEIARVLGCHVNELHLLAQRRILKGAHRGQLSEEIVYVDSQGLSHVVLSPQPGPIWFSSRMLVDEFKRLRNQALGKRGGNPMLGKRVNPTVNQRVNPTVKPTSSTSSSSSSSASLIERARSGVKGEEAGTKARGDDGQDEAIEGAVRAFMRDHPRLGIGNPRDVIKLADMVRRSGWELVRECVDEACERNAQNVVSYAAVVLDSRHARDRPNGEDQQIDQLAAEVAENVHRRKAAARSKQ
jgi:hypothetical protein